MSLVSADDPLRPKRQKDMLQEVICLGCGICSRVCSAGAIHLESRPKRVITPLDSTHRIILMAIERGKLQELIFDNNTLSSHRAMAAILGVILKLPPIKKALASTQMKSRYLETMITQFQVNC